MQPGWQTWVNDADGLVIYNSDGTLTYQPSASASGTKSFHLYGLGTAPRPQRQPSRRPSYQPRPRRQMMRWMWPPAAPSPSTYSPMTATPMADTLTITQINGRRHAARLADMGLPMPTGLVIYNTDGTLTYQPSGSASGTKSFTYTVSGRHGDRDSDRHRGPSYRPRPRRPMTSPLSAPGGSVTIDVLANDSDPNGDTLTITQINGVDMQPGWAKPGSVTPMGLVIYNANGTLTYQPSASAKRHQELHLYRVGRQTKTAVASVIAKHCSRRARWPLPWRRTGASILQAHHLPRHLWWLPKTPSRPTDVPVSGELDQSGTGHLLAVAGLLAPDTGVSADDGTAQPDDSQTSSHF